MDPPNTKKISGTSETGGEVAQGFGTCGKRVSLIEFRNKNVRQGPSTSSSHL
jgi:hypothetical protein